MKIKENIKNLLLVIEGGMGKNIAATGFIKSLKQAYPDKNIIVVAGYPDVFLYNPNIKRIFNFNNPLYLYEDFVNKDSQVLKLEPYLTYGYMNKEEHLINTWCTFFEIPCIQDTPDLYFLENELEAAKIFLDKITNSGKKELLLFQWIGGKIPEKKTPQDLKSSLASMYRRALPFELAEKIHKNLLDMGFVVGTVQHENFPELTKMQRVFFPVRSVIALLKWSKTFIGIDSFLQHAAAANVINKKGLVIWGGTDPITLGYPIHKNLRKSVCPNPECHRPNTYFFDIQANGQLWDCPYGDRCLKTYTEEELMIEINTLIEEFPKKEEVKEEIKINEITDCKDCYNK